MDTLHDNEIEIVSPAFVNQRRPTDPQKTIPRHVGAPLAQPQPTGEAEEIVFDKAERAEQIENQKHELAQEIETLEADLKEASGQDRERIHEDIEQNQERPKALEQKQAELQADDDAAQPDELAE